jgi:hypothetical protein
MDAELKIWITRETTPIKNNLEKTIASMKSYKILSQHILK